MLVVNFHANASFFDVLKEAVDVITEKKLTSGKVDLVLKETLNVGVKNTTTRLGKNDGYFTKPAVKILLQQEEMKVEYFLLRLGCGAELDEFTSGMNKAADKAALLAADIFSKSITDMYFDDAKKILQGGNTAATDYLKARTYNDLLKYFQPAVGKRMSEYKDIGKYEAISGKVQSLSFIGKLVDLELNCDVSTKTPDGLFYIWPERELISATI
jgi:hypothetical protein